MKMKITLASLVLLSGSLLATAAVAQTAPAERASGDTERAAATSSHRAGQWRASKLPGVDVYNEQNEKIGDISDVILDSSGKATKVIVGVGGFLGMGERDVALDFDKLKWMNEPARAKAANTDTTASRATTNVDSNARTANDGGMRTTTGNAERRADRRDNSDWYPDHAVVNATKDQLKQMPEFKY